MPFYQLEIRSNYAYASSHRVGTFLHLKQTELFTVGMEQCNLFLSSRNVPGTTSKYNSFCNSFSTLSPMNEGKAHYRT